MNQAAALSVAAGTVCAITNEHPFLQAALNGDRDHSAMPHTPDEIAANTAAAVAAGAQSVHIHVFDNEGQQTVAAKHVARVLRAVRASCPGIPISLTTSADVEADPASRYRAIEAWTVLPDLVTANQGEDGIAHLCKLLAGRGVGIEAGLLSLDDARALIASGAARSCRRVMVEPLDADPAEAVAHAAAIEKLVTDAGITLEQVHHGDGIASWSVNRRAIPLGHGIRTGLEDTPVPPDGRRARDNAELVAAALTMLGR
jgi:uncharacterized protein (DUF849 family)